MTESVAQDNIHHALDQVELKQSQAADPNYSVWVQANAGAGKTKVLIDRLVRLLLHDAEPGRILALTYTRAAAAEMIDRLYKRLRKWYTMRPEALRGELAALEGVAPDAITPDTIKRAQQLFGIVLETPGGMRISTIHAFCSALLGRFPLEARLPPNPRLIEDSEEDKLWQQAMDRTLLFAEHEMPDALEWLFQAANPETFQEIVKDNRELFSDIFNEFGEHSEQWQKALYEALEPNDEPLNVLIEKAMSPPALPATEIERILNRIEILGKTADGSRLAYLHGLLSNIMNTNNPEQRWQAYLPLISRKVNTFDKSLDGDPDFELFRIDKRDGKDGAEIRRLKRLAPEIIKRQTFEDTVLCIRLAQCLLEQYSDIKATIGALDNTDLIEKTHALFSHISGAEWVLYKLDSQIDHILVDESQDTSPKQWNILEHLFADYKFSSADAIGRTRTRFIVGDEKQSIFSFQGADPDTYRQHQSNFGTGEPGQAQNVNFDVSFRSAPAILHFVDAVWNTHAEHFSAMQSNPDDAQRPIAANRTRHTAFRQGAHGHVALWPSIADNQTSNRTNSVWNIDSEQPNKASLVSRLAKRIALHIGNLLEMGALIGDGKERRRCEPRDFLILLEKRSPLMGPIIHALKRADIPVAGADRIKMSDDIGVQDCLNLMRFVLQPGNDLILAEIIRGPFGINDTEDTHLIQLAHGRPASLWDAIKEDESDAIIELRELLEFCLSIMHAAPHNFLFQILNKQNGWDKLVSRLGPPCIEPIACLLDRALAFESDNVASLQGFTIRETANKADVKRASAKDQNFVRIMTAHGAKGLEAPIVILPLQPSNRPPRTYPLKQYNGWPVWLRTDIKTSIPWTRSIYEAEKSAQLNEKFRLLYVTLTRARDQLYIFDGKQNKNGKSTTNSWSSHIRAALESLDIQPDAKGIMSYGQAIAYKKSDEQADHKGSRASPIPDWLQPQSFMTPIVMPVLRPSEKDNNSKMIAGSTNANISAEKGTLIHALLEVLIAAPVSQRRLYGEAYNKAFFAQTQIPDWAEIALTTVLSLLSNPQLNWLFEPATGMNEVPVYGYCSTLNENRPVSGRIDRLIKTTEGWLILDYKSDQHPATNVASVPVGYIRQLAIYQHFIGISKPNETIQSAILWTQNETLMHLPTSLLTRALQETDFKSHHNSLN